MKAMNVIIFTLCKSRDIQIFHPLIFFRDQIIILFKNSLKGVISLSTDGFKLNTQACKLMHVSMKNFNQTPDL